METIHKMNRKDSTLMVKSRTIALFRAVVIALLGFTLLILRLDAVALSGDEIGNVLIETGNLAHIFNSMFTRIPFGHVEAGLRTGDKFRPYPEEMNRVLTDALADLHFAPTARARDNLLAEGILEMTIHVTGNTVVDALLQIAGRNLPHAEAALTDIPLWADRMVLVTAHRRESFGVALLRPRIRQVMAQHWLTAQVIAVDEGARTEGQR
jgi:UDP-N-acetylglucosamine 2-epimerase (non-hydrolysing)